ncbi:MAG: GlcG/HbpS family heme-binding protein [Stellaceae bacterium]
MQLANKTVLTLEAAKAVSAAAEAEARKNGWIVSIAVLDDSGRLVHLVRMDGSAPASVDVCQAKGRSAALFKRPTKVFSDAVGGGRVAIMALPGAVPVEGGVPLMSDGQCVGAIGVSGVTSEQDGQIGAAGAAVLG